jgi:hypothetical protein
MMDEFVCKVTSTIETDGDCVCNFTKGTVYQKGSTFFDGTIAVGQVVFEWKEEHRNKYSRIWLYDYFYTQQELRSLKLEEIL